MVSGNNCGPLAFVLLIAERNCVDLRAAIDRKIDDNEHRYPVERHWGIARKEPKLLAGRDCRSPRRDDEAPIRCNLRTETTLMSRVSLQELVDQMSWNDDASTCLVWLETGQVLRVLESDLTSLREGDDAEGFDRDDPLAQALIRWDETGEGFATPPGSWDLDAPGMVLAFARSLQPELGERLLAAFQGRGAFRRFKDAAHAAGVLDDWHAWQERSIAAIARRWLKSEGIAFENDLRQTSRTTDEDE